MSFYDYTFGLCIPPQESINQRASRGPAILGLPGGAVQESRDVKKTMQGFRAQESLFPSIDESHPP